MSKSTYTYVARVGNRIFSRGYYESGERFNRKDDFQPTLFIDSKKNQETEWVDLYGKKLYPIQPGTIRGAQDFLDRYKDVSGFEVFGMTNWVTQYISEEFPGEVKLNTKFNRVNVIDIETAVEGRNYDTGHTIKVRLKSEV